MKYPRLGPERAGQLLREGSPLPTADQSVSYPSWYMRRWHFLPDGYLSRRSVRAYEAIIPRLYNLGAEAKAHEQVLEALVERRVRSLVEIGCGTGRFLARARDRLPAASLTGIDLSPFMLERVSERTGAEGVAVRHADAAEHIPGQFDAGIALHTFGHIPGAVAQSAAVNLAGAIVPGGWLVLLEHCWHEMPGLPGFVLERRLRPRFGVLEVQVYQKAAEATSGAAERVAHFEYTRQETQP